jgi:hypothetical protein
LLLALALALEILIVIKGEALDPVREVVNAWNKRH